jgi:hypothetical protein
MGRLIMARLTPSQARSIAGARSIPLDVDFHSLDSETVAHILEAADAYKYKVPRNANGSRARYFHAYLRRTAERRAPLPEGADAVLSSFAEGSMTREQARTDLVLLGVHTFDVDEKLDGALQ